MALTFAPNSTRILIISSLSSIQHWRQAEKNERKSEKWKDERNISQEREREREREREKYIEEAIQGERMMVRGKKSIRGRKKERGRKKKKRKGWRKHDDMKRRKNASQPCMNMRYREMM